MLTKDETPFQTDSSGVRFPYYGKATSKVCEIAGYPLAEPDTCDQSSESVYGLCQPIWSERDSERFHGVFSGNDSDAGARRNRAQARTQGRYNAADVQCFCPDS